MIILDEEAEGRTKNDRYEGLTLRHPQAALTRSSLLPDYHTSEAQHRKALKSAKPTKTPWIDPRIWKASLFALAIYVVLTLTIAVPLTVIRSKKNIPPQNFWDLGAQNSLWANLEDGYVPSMLSLATAGSMAVDFNKSCNDWANSANNTASALYTLPPTGLISIRSNVTYDPKYINSIDGKLSVQMNKDTSVNTVLLTLDMTYSSSRLFEQTNVCFARSGPSRGLAIYIPNNLSDGDTLVFKITVLLPQVTSRVDAFATYLPMLSQYFGDLTTPLSFNSFALEGAARPINCDSLQAPQISIKNLASSITGNFNVTNSITLDTIKGPVASNITLTRPLYCGDRPTVLNIDTGDSSIDATVVLDSLEQQDSSSKPHSPSFAAQARTFNGPLNLNVTYRSKSTPAPLQLRVQNNLAPSVISLDAAYQGTVSAQSKLDQVTVNDSGLTSGDDPTGANRSRTLAWDQVTNSQVAGWVGWGLRPLGMHVVQSSVDIFSALSPVFLTFEPT